MNALKTKILPILLAAILIPGTIFAISNNVSSISQACKNSPDCMAAVAKEQEANQKAAEADATANAYAAEVANLNSQIATLEAEIAESQARAEELQKQIEETEAKLQSQQAALADLLVQLHFDTKTDSITLLAGAKTLSDYAERQARTETIKTQVNVSAQHVKEAKEQLERDKASVEEIIASQEEMKIQLANTRASQQALVDKYKSDSAAYAKDAEAAREAQKAAMEAYAREHPELYGGGVYFGANTYPWQEKCPGQADAYATSVNGVAIGGLVCECVSYVGWKAWEEYGQYLNWGNAYSWDDIGRSRGVVDNTPAAGTIGQTDSGPYGHVFWVESVNADGSINVTEYNNAASTQLYGGTYQWWDFGSRKIAANQVGLYNYIHVDRL